MNQLNFIFTSSRCSGGCRLTGVLRLVLFLAAQTTHRGPVQIT